MFAIIGNLAAAMCLNVVNDEKKRAKKGDVADAFAVSAADLLYRTVKSSVLDFNIGDSLIEPVTLSNPFAFTYLQSTAKRVYGSALGLAKGEEDWYKGIVNSTSATRTWRPVFDAILE